MPGGHLVTSLFLGGGAYAATGSPELAAGCVLGGFFIDVDHYVDYVVFEGQWRRPGPRNFLKYYFSHKPRRLVLPLHSFELMTILAGIALATGQPLLWGYLIGAAMHLLLDVIVNGDCVLLRPVAFYSFIYRAMQRFSADALIAPIAIAPNVGSRPFMEFFTWRPAGEKLGPAGTGSAVECRGPALETGVNASRSGIQIPPSENRRQR